MKKKELIPTGNAADNVRIVRIHPRLVILKSLGGFTAGMEDKATRVDEELNEFMLKHRLIIMPGHDGRLRFVSSAVLTEENPFKQ